MNKVLLFNVHFSTYFAYSFFPFILFYFFILFFMVLLFNKMLFAVHLENKKKRFIVLLNLYENNLHAFSLTFIHGKIVESWMFVFMGMRGRVMEMKEKLLKYLWKTVVQPFVLFAHLKATNTTTKKTRKFDFTLRVY